ncbi:MAG: hypothetical protein HY735_14530 [Verrucomicrobia bacterium]|nr:hypothetical protein [Verrucomicrobiota bacterium]
MKSESCCGDKARIAAYCVGILGSFLIMAGMVWLMRQYTQPPPPDLKRIEERRKAAREASLAAQELETYGYIDATKGQVRLPVLEIEGQALKLGRAAQLVMQEWKNSAGGRSNLVARWARFNPPPPKPVEKKSEFE